MFVTWRGLPYNAKLFVGPVVNAKARKYKANGSMDEDRMVEKQG